MNKIALQIFFHHLVPLREKQNFHDMNFETRIVEKVVCGKRKGKYCA